MDFVGGPPDPDWVREAEPMSASRTRIVLLAALIGAACSSSSGRKPFTWSVDPTLAPVTATLPDPAGQPRPVTTFRDSSGVQTDFVENELIVSPASDADLASFLTRYQGTVVRDNKDLPLSFPNESPPAGLPARARQVLVRIGLPLGDLSGMDADSHKAGFGGGGYTFASQAGVHLVATAFRENAAGHKVGPNFVAPGSGFIHWTQEYSTGPSQWANGFLAYAFNGALKGVTNKSTVVGAWQYLESIGYVPRSVRVAVIDGGFWLDATGHPYDQGPGTDFPATPLQWNYHEGGPYAGGMNPNKCTGGSTCNWHGNGSAGTATGIMNNQKGFAGTGAQVANPVLLKFDGSDSEFVDAMNGAMGFGARVISLSFGGPCNGACVWWRSTFTGFFGVISGALASGIVVVAAAGNDTVDVTANTYLPCVADGVICVGALGSYNDGAISYSNFGAGVGIWAPTDIPVMPNGDDPTKLANHNGTSASTPFVAGVVAMMLAVNPALGPADVKAILQQTAWTGSSDPKVSPGYLDALGAVMKAGNYYPPDALEPDDTPATAASLANVSSYPNLNIHRPGDVDFYRLTLTDFSWLDFTLQNMPEGFGKLGVIVSHESAFADPDFVTETFDPVAGYHYRAVASAGTYLLRVAGAIQPYDLITNVTAASLSPDVCEPNDTSGTACNGTAWNGSSPFNFHVTTDVDWFTFTVGGIPDTNHYLFLGIPSCSVPVQLDIYDGSLNLLASDASAAPYHTFGMADNGKTFFARVTSTQGAKGLYELVKEMMSVPTIIPPFVKASTLPFINPSDPSPFQGVLGDVEGWLAFTAGASAVGGPALNTVNLGSSALHLGIYDGTGALLGEGTATASGETLSFGSVTTAGQTYYLHLTRNNPWSPSADLPGALPPRVGYQIGFAP